MNRIFEVEFCRLYYNPSGKEAILVYYDIMRRLQNIFNIRPQMVKLAQEKGICESARLRNTTGKTVRKWVTRYREGGLRGLANRK
ncbi:MAG: hypothetical protein ACUVWA_13095, partial [Candidatus Oleimicrobiaceae bacterium]